MYLKLKFLAITLPFLFASCERKVGSNVREHNKTYCLAVGVGMEEKAKQQESRQTQFYIKDEKQYSETFIAEFKAKHRIYETVELIYDTIVINCDRENFILIPTDLPLERLVIYEERAEGIKYRLTVKRVNYSTIEYNYFETVNGKKKNEKQGLADLEPVFYFGTEGTFEDEGGNVYGMNEYVDSSIIECQILIYIGVGNINKTFLKHHCESGTNMFETPLLTIIK